MPVLPRPNPQKSPSFKNFFPRSHFRPCRGIRNWLPVCDLTFIYLIFLKKRVLTLVLLSDTPENTCFGHPPNVSPGRKIRDLRPFWGDTASKVVSSDPQSDQFDPSKWSVWGYNWLWKFENLPRKFEKRLWKRRKVRQKWGFSRWWWGRRSLEIGKWSFFGQPDLHF